MKIFLLALILFCVVIALEGLRVYLQIKKSTILTENSSPYQQSIENPSLRILVLGDSTAVGTGAFSNRDSTAGRLGQLYPKAEIVNLAVNGLRIEGLIKILDTQNFENQFDIVLIQIGANDIIRQTPFPTITKGIQEVLAKTTALGEVVIVLHSGNIGDTSFFPWFIRPLLSERSLKVREIYTETASKQGVHYVDLIDSPVPEIIQSNPALYYATDGLHLSGEGYGLWFKEIEKYLPKQ